jgi:hypothetical protein
MTDAYHIISDEQLGVLHNTAVESMERLYRASEAQGGRARLLCYGAAGYLKLEGILEGMLTMASFIETRTFKHRP